MSEDLVRDLMQGAIESESADVMLKICIEKISMNQGKLPNNPKSFWIFSLIIFIEIEHAPNSQNTCHIFQFPVQNSKETLKGLDTLTNLQTNSNLLHQSTLNSEC